MDERLTDDKSDNLEKLADAYLDAWEAYVAFCAANSPLKIKPKTDD